MIGVAGFKLMNTKVRKIAVVAPASRIEPSVAEKVKETAKARFGDKSPEIIFHPQCYLSQGHFAGSDEDRASALLDVANDPSLDAVWFARGGYGSCRLLDLVIPNLSDIAKDKTYLGYSDMGFLLGALYGKGFAHVIHGPMPADVLRKGGEVAVQRSLDFLIGKEPATLEPELQTTQKSAAFNISVLSEMLGTPYQPDLSGHVLILEEIAEYMYAIDRALFHITSNPEIRKIEGIRLGRCSQIPSNDPDFEQSEEEIVQHWCKRSGIPYLGRADIGHDANNKIVPFGTWAFDQIS